MHNVSVQAAFLVRVRIEHASITLTRGGYLPDALSRCLVVAKIKSWTPALLGQYPEQGPGLREVRFDNPPQESNAGTAWAFGHTRTQGRGKTPAPFRML